MQGVYLVDVKQVMGQPVGQKQFSRQSAESVARAIRGEVVHVDPLARDYLERSRYRVLAAGEGRAALAMARQERPDLVVLDLNLPGMDGLDVCRTLLDEAQVRMAGPQTMLGDAVGLAIHVFEESETEERVLIVLTEGSAVAPFIYALF